MDYEQTLLGFVLCTAGVLAVAWVFSAARAAWRRRTRRARYLREAQAFHASAREPEAAVEGISPERAAGITREAEIAAWRVARGAQPVATNPHGPRTREFVLWEASFHSALSDYADLADLPDKA